MLCRQKALARIDGHGFVDSIGKKKSSVLDRNRSLVDRDILTV
jgi:hypothetical protein